MCVKLRDGTYCMWYAFSLYGFYFTKTALSRSFYGFIYESTLLLCLGKKSEHFCEIDLEYLDGPLQSLCPKHW